MEKESEHCARDTSVGCLLYAPNWGPGQQPRHVPWLRIEPATFQFAGQCPIHWATPGWEDFKLFCSVLFNKKWPSNCNNNNISPSWFRNCVTAGRVHKSWVNSEPHVDTQHCHWWAQNRRGPAGPVSHWQCFWRIRGLGRWVWSMPGGGGCSLWTSPGG